MSIALHLFMVEDTRDNRVRLERFTDLLTGATYLRFGVVIQLTENRIHVTIDTGNTADPNELRRAALTYFSGIVFNAKGDDQNGK